MMRRHESTQALGGCRCPAAGSQLPSISAWGSPARRLAGARVPSRFWLRPSCLGTYAGRFRGAEAASKRIWMTQPSNRNGFLRNGPTCLRYLRVL